MHTTYQNDYTAKTVFKDRPIIYTMWSVKAGGIW